MWKEFKEFALKGNVIDLAIAVVIGAAFGAIVNSLVKDIIMPIIGYLTAGADFAALKVVLRPAAVVNGVEVAETAITYGVLIQTIIQFLIIAFSIFLMVRALNKASARMEAKNKVEAAIEEQAKSDETVLLAEIRDLLKEKN
ncbi:MAG: large-conductance mechanosensitive channel protein MscL [Ruminococcaceae bacterium]|nr:large-conductance mechanosensitive channel protein MscL [Oscillospiraceae bacterium]